MRLPCAGIFLIPALASGQFIYNQQKDETAQQALKAAQELASGATFDKQLENLARLEKFSNERVFTGAELQMRANLLLLGTWKGVRAEVNQVEARIKRSQQGVTQKQFDDEAKQASDAAAAAKENLKKLKDAATKSKVQSAVNTAGTWLERAAKLDEVLEFAPKIPKLGLDKKIPAAYLTAAKEAAAAANSLAELYKNFTVTLPASPQVIALETHLAMLDLEVDHLANLAIIAGRRDREVFDTLDIIQETQAELDGIDKMSPPADVDESLRRAAAALGAAGDADRRARRIELFTMVHCLYNAAALAARDETPLRLADLRRASEERAYSIRQSAAAARSYEQTLLSGVGRLALYYKGGFRPQTIAQFINALATVGLIPSVLTR